MLLPLCRVHSDPDLYRDGIALRHRWGFSLYDSLVVAAAIRGGCTTLYTEDLQHGQQIGGLLVTNPFV